VHAARSYTCPRCMAARARTRDGQSLRGARARRAPGGVAPAAPVVLDGDQGSAESGAAATAWEYAAAAAARVDGKRRTGGSA
jgi:hypothetical protein